MRDSGSVYDCGVYNGTWLLRRTGMFGDNLTERFQLASDRIKEICVGSDCQQGEPWSI